MRMIRIYPRRHVWQINLSLRPREIVGHVVELPVGYNLWASSCRQVIRAQYLGAANLLPSILSNSKAKPGPGFGFKNTAVIYHPALVSFGYTCLIVSSSTLSVRCSSNSQSEELFKWVPFKVNNFGKLIRFLGEGSWKNKVGGGWLLILSISQRGQSFPRNLLISRNCCCRLFLLQFSTKRAHRGAAI